MSIYDANNLLYYAYTHYVMLLCHYTLATSLYMVCFFHLKLFIRRYALSICWRGSEDPRLMECMELNVYGVALDIDRKEFKESAKAVSEFSFVAIFSSTC